MKSTRRIEVFSAGCPICDDTIKIINELTCSSCEVVVLDLQDPDVAARAASLSITSIPAVTIDGKLADCCTGRGVSRETLIAAGVGIAL